MRRLDPAPEESEFEVNDKDDSGGANPSLEKAILSPKPQDSSLVISDSSNASSAQEIKGKIIIAED